MICFLIGNGISRKDFNLKKLRHYGKVIICNEAYREFDYFDAITSVDGGSTIDIREHANVNTDTQVHIHKWRNNWFLNNKDIGQLIGSYNSGQLALKGIIELYHPSLVYMFGVDLGGKRLFTGKIMGQPTNKCYTTWDELRSKIDTIIRVPQDITWEEFCLREGYVNE